MRTSFLSPRLLIPLLLLLALFAARDAFGTSSFAESYGTDSYDGLGQPTTDDYYGSGWDWPTSMAKMPDGGCVVGGQIDTPSLYANNHSSFAAHTGGISMGSLVRLAPDGTILWQQTLRLSNDSYDPLYGVWTYALTLIVKVATDSSGNIFVWGFKESGSGPVYAPFVAKFSPGGQLLWQNGIDHVNVTEGDPGYSFQTGTFSNYLGGMTLTNDGGILVTFTQLNYGDDSGGGQRYDVAIAKFSASGALSFYKVYVRGGGHEYAVVPGQICQSKDGSRYILALPNDYDYSSDGFSYHQGLTFLVFDLNGNLLAEKRYVPGDGPGEIPFAIIPTSDGGFATLSRYFGGYASYADVGIVTKFSSDLSTQLFREEITGATAPVYGQLVTNTLTELPDGGLLIGGATANRAAENDPYDALMMKLSSAGALQFATTFGGPRTEGGEGGFQQVGRANFTIRTTAIPTADNGYALATNSYSYQVGNAGTGCLKPDWWIVKTDANRQVRNFTGGRIDLPLDAFTIASSSQPMLNVSSYYPAPYQYEAITATDPSFIIRDLGSMKLPDQPTLQLQAGSPRIISSRNAEAVVTRHFAYHILTAFFPTSSTLTYSATGLPNGFVIDSATGVISGVPPAGSQTATPIQINLSVTDGTDTATGAVFLTIGDGPPSLTVNGSAEPAYPGAGTPVTGLADSVLTFVAKQAGAPAGRSMTAEASTTPDVSGSWQRLTNGSEGFMPFEQQSSAFVLGTNIYPRANAVYFRVRSVTPDRPDAFSNIVGPFDLNSTKPRLGKTNLFITHNGPVANIRWGVTEETLVDGIQVRVQATKTPSSEGSWYPVAPLAQDTTTPAPNEFYHGLDDYPSGEGIYFRAIASADGYVDSISAMNGPYTFIYDPAPEIALTIPGVSGTDAQDFDSPITPPSQSFNFAADATTSPNRQITNLSLIYDGDELDHSTSQHAAVPFTTTTMGDHIFEAVATDDLGVIGDAAPVHVRVAPAAPGKILYLTADGSWSNPAIWDDGNGNHAVPGVNDFAVLGHGGVTLTGDVIVGALSMNGATINYAGGTPFKITVFKQFTVSGGRIYTDIEIADSGNMLMLNDADLQLGGLITNNGRLKIHGKGGITGIPGSSSNAFAADPDGLFDFVGKLVNKFLAIFQRPAGGRRGSTPHPAPPPNPPPAPEIRAVEVSNVTNQAKVVSNDGGTLVSEHGGGVVAQGAGNVVSNDGGTLAAKRATGLVDKNGNPLISQDGGNLLAKAAIIGEHSSGIIGEHSSGIIGEHGSGILSNANAGIVATGGGNLMRTAAALNIRGTGGSVAFRANAAGATPGFVQTAGEFDLSGLSITGPVELDGGILSGTGPIVGDVTNNGAFITPGHSTGLVTITGNFTQNSGGTLTIQAEGGEKQQFDQVRVGGSAALGGKLNVFTSNNYVPLPNDPFAPIDYNGVTGAFNTVNSNVATTITSTGVVTSLPSMSLPPPALQLSTIKSRKTHGSAGTFDVNLGLDGSGIECRAGLPGSGNYTLVFTFTNPISDIAGAAVSSGTGSVASSNVDANAQQYIVDLTGVSNSQALNVSLTNLQDIYGQTNSSVSGVFKVLIGDANGDGVVNSGDATITRNRSGQGTNATNFRADYNLDGFVNSGDATIVRGRSGNFLPGADSAPAKSAR